MYVIKKEKPTWEVPALVRDQGAYRPLVIVVSPDGLLIKQKGRRRFYFLPWAIAYTAAVKIAVHNPLKGDPPC